MVWTVGARSGSMQPNPGCSVNSDSKRDYLSRCQIADIFAREFYELQQHLWFSEKFQIQIQILKPLPTHKEERLEASGATDKHNAALWKDATINIKKNATDSDT